jgi:hypothetical protein
LSSSSAVIDISNSSRLSGDAQSLGGEVRQSHVAVQEKAGRIAAVCLLLPGYQ